MAGDPFYYQLNQDFRGTKVRVPTDGALYTGWVRMWHYDQHAILLYDAVREQRDGEGEPVEVGPVTIDQPETVERIESIGPIEEVPVDSIEPSPYSAREFDDPDHQQFVEETRERGHLLTFPTVRPIASGKYETVGGHKRMEAARRAGLDELAVRVVEMDDWKATERFVDEHIPIEGGQQSGMYSQQEIDRALTSLLSRWDADQLRELDTLAPYLTERLSSTREEALKRGYLADGA